MRDDPKLYNTDKERSLYTMLDESYFNLAREATNAGMAVDIFACTHQYFDISSTGAICAVTGGQVYYHPRFSSAVDGERLHYQFMRIMTNRMGM
jgi:protein transport protein SEC24